MRGRAPPDLDDLAHRGRAAGDRASRAGAATSSKRPDSSCSSSVTSAWKRRPFLSTSTMSPAPMPLEVVRGAAGGRGGGSTSIRRLVCTSATLGAVADGPRTASQTRAVQRDVLLAVGAHADDRGALGGRARASSAARKRVDVRGALVAAAVQRGGVGEVEPVRRGDVLARSPSPSPATGRKWKMPPPSLSISTIVELQAEARRGQQAADVVGERDVADQQHDRARAPPRRRRTRSRPCRRSRSRRGWRARAAASSRAGKNVSTSRTGIEEATTSVASAGSRDAELGGHARLAQPAPGRASRAIAPGGGAVGARASRRASRASRRARQPLGERVERRARVGADDRRRRRRPGPATRPRGRSAICSASPSPCSHWRSGLEVGRSPTRSDELGRVRGGPAPGRAAARRSARSRPGPRRAPDSGSASSGSAGALGEARPAPRRAAGRARRGPATITRARARRRARRASPSSSASARPRARVRGRVTHGRPPARPPPPGSSSGSGAVGHERLAQREVQVHRARAAVERGPERAAGELAQPAHARRRRRVVVDLEEPLGGAAVELDLVDRLPGADLAQLGRAVGGEHEQRHARLVRLDHRGRVVGRRGARACRRARPGTPGRLGQPEREEARRSARRCATSRAAAARARATSTSGVEREPGEVHASRRPQRASSSTKARRPR